VPHFKPGKALRESVDALPMPPEPPLAEAKAPARAA
jgi:hypothetical protein